MTSTSSRSTSVPARSVRRRRGASRQLAGILVAVCAVLALRGAAAGDSVLPAAKAAYQEGLRQYNAEHFAEAAQLFERAYALQGRSLLLFNIAQCQRKMGSFERALESYRRYLTLVGPSDPPATVEDARRYVAELEAYVTNQRELAARNARPPVDSAPPSRPEPRLDTTPVPRPEPSAEPAPAPQPLVVSTPPSPRRPLVRSPWLWTGVALGVVAVGLGIGLGVGLGTRSHDTTPETTLGTYTPVYP